MIPSYTYVWIHIPIPTPVLIANARVSLDKVFYLFHAASGAALTHIDVYDGRNKLASENAHVLNGIEGDYSQGIDTDRNSTRLPEQPQIIWGVSVSLLVSGGGSGRFYVATAGADFILKN
jgi:hypothetical protein